MLRYKACRNSIVTLELLEDSKNTEKRFDVANDKYAKFRCNRAKVVNITNVKTGEKMEKDVSIYDHKFIYRLGKIVKTDFDRYLNRVCTRGIHYFKTEETALSWFYSQKVKPDGKWIEWYENGHKYSEGTYKDGIEDGKWTWWWDYGNKRSEGTYKDGKKDGKWIEWWDDGQKYSETIFKDGYVW